MKKLLFLFTAAVLFCSCGVDPSKIIGQKFDQYSLPYGTGGAYGKMFVGGTRLYTYATYYRGRPFVYVHDYVSSDNNYIVGYYFSNFVTYDEAVRKVPIGSHVGYAIKRLGKPFEYYAWSDILDAYSGSGLFQLSYLSSMLKIDGDLDFHGMLTVLIFRDGKLVRIDTSMMP